MVESSVGNVFGQHYCSQTLKCLFRGANLTISGLSRAREQQLITASNTLTPNGMSRITAC